MHSGSAISAEKACRSFARKEHSVRIRPPASGANESCERLSWRGLTLQRGDAPLRFVLRA